MSAKKVAIMVDEMYQVLEVWYPYYRFCEAGLEVNLIAAEAKKEYHSKEDYPCISEIVISFISGSLMGLFNSSVLSITFTISVYANHLSLS